MLIWPNISHTCVSHLSLLKQLIVHVVIFCYFVLSSNLYDTNWSFSEIGLSSNVTHFHFALALSHPILYVLPPLSLCFFLLCLCNSNFIGSCGLTNLRSAKHFLAVIDAGELRVLAVKVHIRGIISEILNSNENSVTSLRGSTWQNACVALILWNCCKNKTK